MDKTLTLTKQNVLLIILLDTISGIAMYCIPALSHIVAYPLYYFDPMRCIVLLGFLSYRNKWNSAFLALTLPLISYFISGHPIIIKNAIISVELLVNVILLSFFLERKVNSFVAVLGSIVISKFIYYGLKYTAIKLSFLQTNIIDTNIMYQVVVCIVIACIWTLVNNRRYERS